MSAETNHEFLERSMKPIHLYDGNGNWVRKIFPGIGWNLVDGGNHAQPTEPAKANGSQIPDFARMPDSEERARVRAALSTHSTERES